MSKAALSRSAEPGPSGGSAPRGGVQFLAWLLVAISLVLIGVKPLSDIPGEKTPNDTVDLGMVVTTIGAGLMVVAFVLLLLTARRLPAKLTPALVALLLLGALSVVNLLAVDARGEFIEQFDRTGMRDIFGSYVPPVRGVLTQAAQMAVGFAPVLLVALMLLRPAWFPSTLVRWVLWLVLLGALAHAVIAWLQVAGVVPYTFFFKLPGGNIGRASGGYFHPASLGRLLIFAVFILYAAGRRLRMPPVARFGLGAIMVATAVVSTHRLTILCVLLVIVAMEARRVPQLLEWLWGLPFKVAIAGIVAVLGVVIALVIRFWERGVFLLTQIGSLDVTDKDFMRGRGEIWFEIGQAWRSAPLDVWLIGLGYEPWNTHSDPLRIFVVWGVLGVLLMGVVFVTLWRVTSSLLSAEGRWALGVLYFATAIFALTQKPTSYSYYMWLFLLSHLLLAVFHPRTDTDRAPVDSGGETR